jgi:hypothetical protein
MAEEKEKDLILGKEGEAEEEVDYDTDDLHAEIASAYYALSAIEDIDEKLMPKEKAKYIRDIKTKSLEIIHNHICEIHSSIFEKKVED